MPKDHVIKECHYDLETREWTERSIGSTTVKQDAFDWLHHQKMKGRMATTLSHWYVGDTRVEAQTVLELCVRQGFIKKDVLKDYDKGRRRKG